MSAVVVIDLGEEIAELTRKLAGQGVPVPTKETTR